MSEGVLISWWEYYFVVGILYVLGTSYRHKSILKEVFFFTIRPDSDVKRLGLDIIEKIIALTSYLITHLDMLSLLS